MPSWIWKSWDESVFEDLDMPGVEGLRDMIIQFKTNISCAEEDLVVAEMLIALEPEPLEILYRIFLQRILTQPGGVSSDDCWDTHTARCLLKAAGACAASKLRPIALLSILYRLFSRLLARLAGPPLHELKAPQFAFRRGHQPHEVIHIFRSLVEKTNEWQLHLYVLDGDIYKTYDCVSHRLAIRALRRKGVMRAIVAA